MKKIARGFVAAMGIGTLLFSSVNISYGQSNQGKFGIGLNAGAQRIYGDRPEEYFGFGAEGLVSYRILPFADIALGLGYGQLRYNFVPGTSGTTTDMFNADLKGNLEIVSKGMVRPYLTLGLGLLNYEIRNSGFGNNTDAAFFGGGGLKLQLGRAFNWFVGADYRFTTGDTFDNSVDEGTANDGFLNVRSGITYHLGEGRSDDSQIIAEERAPFFEVNDEPDLFATQSQARSPLGPEQETKDMEEYVKLKSRIDALSGEVNSKENEILALQRSLGERKKMLTSLESRASTKPKVRIRQNSSMSGFSEIYQEALTNYYNKNYSEAVSLFKLLLQQYSNNSLASHCQFWIGKCLLAMNRNQQAIDELHKVLSFDRSLKRDDSLFLLGKAYLKIGSGDLARESFSRLLRDYPDSEFVEEAKSYIAKL